MFNSLLGFPTLLTVRVFHLPKHQPDKNPGAFVLASEYPAREAFPAEDA